MKKNKYVVLACLATVALAGCQSSTSSETSGPDASSDSEKVLVVGADPTFRPISFENEAGEITGFDRDFAQALADEMGYELDYRPIAWDGIIPSLESGNIDAITNMVVTDERKEKVAFSEPYMKQTIMAVVRSGDNSEYDSLADLQDARVGVMGGTGSATQVETAGLTNVAQYNTAQDLYQDLALSRVDVAVIESFSGGYAVKENFSDKLQISNPDIGSTPTVQAVAMRLTDAELVKAVNKAIERMIDSGALAEIVEKWFGELDYEIS